MTKPTQKATQRILTPARARELGRQRRRGALQPRRPEQARSDRAACRDLRGASQALDAYLDGHLQGRRVAARRHPPRVYRQGSGLDPSGGPNVEKDYIERRATLLDVLHRITGWDWVFPRRESPGDLARNVAPPSLSLVAYVRPVEADDPGCTGRRWTSTSFPAGYSADRRSRRGPLGGR